MTRGVIPAHPGSSSLHPAHLAWLLRTLLSAVLAREEIPLRRWTAERVLERPPHGAWMKARAWTIASLSLDEGERERERVSELNCSLL